MMLGALAALGTSITWTLGSSAYTHLSRRYSPFAINLNRALFGLIVFIALSLLDADNVRAQIEALGPAIWTNVAWLFLSILTTYVIGDALFLRSAVSIGFPAAQALGAIYPMWATLAAVLFTSEPMSPLRAVGLALAVTGVVIVVLSGKKETGQLHRAGIGLALATSVFWGISSFAVSRGGVGLNPAFANIIRMMFAVVLCPIMGRKQPLFLDRADYRRFGALMMFEAGIGSTIYVYGLSHTPVAIGSTLSSMAPIFSVPLAIALGWEKFSLQKALAICVVIGGLFLLVQ